MRAGTFTALCVLLVGCGGTSSGTSTPAPDPLSAAYVEFQAEAIEALNAYWSPIAVREGIPFEEPRVAAYRAGSVPDTSCADDTVADEWVEEVFYCFDDGTVAFDADFLSAVHEADGADPALGILAHEWGHHLQSLTVIPEHDLQVELQADCYAGVFLANHTGDPTASSVTLEAMASFVDGGDERYEQSSWFAFEEHGSPELRWSAFVTGALGIDDLTLCEDYGGYVPQPPIDIGDYVLAHPPGFRADVSEAEVTLRRGDVSVHLVPLTGTVGATADSIGLVLWDSYFEGFTVQREDPVIVNTPYGGQWATWTYVAARGDTTVVGVLRVHSHADGEALLVDSSMEDPAVTEPYDDAENRILMSVVLPAFGLENFLCGPGQNGERDTEGFAFSCAIEFAEP